MAHTPRRSLVILCVALIMLLVGTGMAQAATVNGVNRIVSVGDDYKGYPRTILTITEEADTLDSFVVGESFELRLPEGVKWYEEETSGLASYHPEDIVCQNCAIDVKLRGDRVIGITFVEADAAALSRLDIPLVFEVEGYLGDIEVTIDPIDSNVSGGQYLFAQVPYKLVPVPEPEPDPEPVPQPIKQQVVFTIGSSFFSIDGEVQPEMDVQPYIKDNRTYLPLRFVAYSLGMDDQDIQWDGETRRVVLTKGEQQVQVWIGSRALDHNGTLSDMDAAPEIWQQRTMLPVRPVVEAFGGSVKWDPALRTVTIVMASNHQSS